MDNRRDMNDPVLYLQIQQKANVYNGTIDCFRKIYQGEGVRGLYKGFWVSGLAFQLSIFIEI